MDREFARQQLAAQLEARTRLIQDYLQPGEKVLDSGEVNELALNTVSNLGAGEALLFVTNQRLILHRSGATESLPYEDIGGFRLGRAPRGVPQRRAFRELTLNLAGGEERSMIGGRMFLSAVESAMRR